jgi:hypothetical protein
MTAEMQGVTIRDVDERNVLTFDLRDILRLLGTAGTKSTWEVEGLECVGPEADRFLERSNAPLRIDGLSLLRLSETVDQVIDGTFRGFRHQNDDQPWIVVSAVDSSAYDVQTNDARVLDLMRRSFKLVVPIPTPDG